MEVIKAANLGLRFVLELCALGAIGYWGFHATKSTSLRWVLGIGAPLVVAGVWSLFVAPQSAVDLSAGAKLILGVAILGACAAALAAVRQPALAGAFGVVIVANAVLMQVWHQ